MAPSTRSTNRDHLPWPPAPTGRSRSTAPSDDTTSTAELTKPETAQKNNIPSIINGKPTNQKAREIEPDAGLSKKLKGLSLKSGPKSNGNLNRAIDRLPIELRGEIFRQAADSSIRNFLALAQVNKAFNEASRGSARPFLAIAVFEKIKPFGKPAYFLVTTAKGTSVADLEKATKGYEEASAILSLSVIQLKEIYETHQIIIASARNMAWTFDNKFEERLYITEAEMPHWFANMYCMKLHLCTSDGDDKWYSFSQSATELGFWLGLQSAMPKVEVKGAQSYSVYDSDDEDEDRSQRELLAFIDIEERVEESLDAFLQESKFFEEYAEEKGYKGEYTKNKQTKMTLQNERMRIALLIVEKLDGWKFIADFGGMITRQKRYFGDKMLKENWERLLEMDE